MPLKVQLPLPTLGLELYKLGVQIRAKIRTDFEVLSEFSSGRI